MITLAKIRKIDAAPAYDKYASTKVTTMGHITEVTTFAKKPQGPPIKKINKDLYVDLRLGEVFDYKHIESRAESAESIRRTLSNIRALVNTNVTDPDRCRWVTLTYRENMTDTKRLYEDFRRFWQKFCYWCKTNGHSKPEYITVQEPQGRGAWHIHAFFIWAAKAPFVPNDTVLAPMWGHGFTKIKAIADCDNIGAYFSAYLGDLPLDEAEKLPPDERSKALAAGDVMAKTFTNDQEHVKDKKFIKGGRLALYPPGMNIVRKTKGIKLPTVERMTYVAAQKKVGPDRPTFSRTYEIIDGDSGQVLNTLTKSYYNSRRK